MFKPHYGTCIECKKDGIIAVKKGYCQRCNHEQKQAKKKQSGKPSANYHYLRKPTGEAELFKEIANEQEHKCFVCGAILHELTVSNFMHVLPKALNKYPKMKLYKPNIVLGCHDSFSSCHNRFDKEPRSTLIEPMWQRLFDLETELKAIYKTL